MSEFLEELAKAGVTVEDLGYQECIQENTGLRSTVYTTAFEFRCKCGKELRGESKVDRRSAFLSGNPSQFRSDEDFKFHEGFKKHIEEHQAQCGGEP